MSDYTSTPVIVPAYGAAVVWSASDEPDKVACHLVLDLPVPYGRVHALLSGDQIAAIWRELDRAVNATPEERRDFAGWIHTETLKAEKKDTNND